MVETNINDKEFQNAMSINKDNQSLTQIKDQMTSIQNEYNATQLSIAGKGTDALKLYDELVRGMDDCFLKVLSDSGLDDDFHFLEMITDYDREYASDLRHLSRYWPVWYETLEYYKYFLTHRKYGVGGYTFIHETFVRWLKDVIGESATTYTLAVAYNVWFDAKMATTDYSED